jgi:hypothetical protein
MMMMNAQTAFANTIAIQCDVPCPAIQDAIDRLVSGEGFRGRNGMIEAMRSPLYTALNFNSSLLSAWKETDIKRATGQSRDWWIRLAEEMKAAR